MESIQQFLLFVVCMVAVSESYARIGFTGNDMNIAATESPSSAPEMDNCREACQQKVYINEYYCRVVVSTVQFVKCKYMRNCEYDTGIQIEWEINSFFEKKKNRFQIDDATWIAPGKKQSVMSSPSRRKKIVKWFPLRPTRGLMIIIWTEHCCALCACIHSIIFHAELHKDL